jgi:predicted nicotinamide N-methyase
MEIREPGAAAIEEWKDVGGLAVHLLRPATLAGAVDAEALLSGDPPEEPPYWMHLWPGARALAAVVATAPRIGHGCRVVELGCGLGLPSLAAARRGALVCATDWKRDPLLWARESAKIAAAPVRVFQMSWSAPAVRACFDVCLGADIAYDAAAEPMLVAALARVLRPGGVAWLADSVNTHRATLATALEAAGFSVSVASRREEEEGRAVWVRIVEARRDR